MGPYQLIEVADACDVSAAATLSKGADDEDSVRGPAVRLSTYELVSTLACLASSRPAQDVETYDKQKREVHQSQGQRGKTARRRAGGHQKGCGPKKQRLEEGRRRAW